jgi:hypothetical protein
MDKAGRVIPPNPPGTVLGLLHAGSDLEIHETPEEAVLRPVARRPSLVQKGRFWVHIGEIPQNCEILKAIDDDREERITQSIAPVKW